MRGQLNVDKIIAFIVRDQDGTEGIAAFPGPGGMWMPMVAADAERARSLEPMAQAIANSGLVVTVAEFSKRENVRTFEPNRTKIK